MCKHVAAVMYGIGSRLDTDPSLLFLLRGVDQKDLISEALDTAVVDEAESTGLDTDDLGSMFGIELSSSIESTDVKAKPRPRPKATKKKTAKKKAPSKKPAPKKALEKKSAEDKNVKKKSTVKKSAKPKSIKKKTPG